MFRILSRSWHRLAEVHLPGLLYIAFIGAVISAILSVVHSALHAPAAQISHNLIERVDPALHATAASCGRCGSPCWRSVSSLS